MSSIDEFVTLARARLGADVLKRSGATFYSAASTLRPGDVYVLGVNPGGGPEITSTIGDSLDQLPANMTNSYLDEDWGKGQGKAPLQQRLTKLAACLDLDLRDVCASNLVFMRSRDMSGIKFWKDAELCWPLHDLVLDTVRPKLILTFGNSADSPYAFLREKLTPSGPEDSISSGHGSWQCRGFQAKRHGNSVYVAGFPHLSRYRPLGDDGEVRPNVAKWLRGRFINTPVNV